MRAAWRKASVLRGLAVGSVCSEKAAFQPERAVGILQGRPRVGRRDSCPRGTSELSAGTPLFGKGCSAGLKSSPSQRVGFVLGSGLRGGNVVPLRAADKEVRTERCPLGVAGGAQWQGATTGDSVCTPKAGYDCARDARAHRDTVDFGVGCGAARAAGIEVAEACLASLGATGPARAKVTDLSRIADSGNGEAEERGTLRQWRIGAPFGRSERQPVGALGQGADCVNERTASPGVPGRGGSSLALGQGGEEAGRAASGRQKGRRPRAASRCGQARRGGPERWERQGGWGRQVGWPQGLAMLGHRARLLPSEGALSSPGVVAVHCGATKQPNNCNPCLPVSRLREVGRANRAPPRRSPALFL